MKLFRVIAERDGKTIKEPGITSTELIQSSYYYCAETLQKVWDATDWLRNDPEVTVLSLSEVVGGVTILSGNETP